VYLILLQVQSVETQEDIGLEVCTGEPPAVETAEEVVVAPVVTACAVTAVETSA
jgi:hypothetical protein